MLHLVPVTKMLRQKNAMSKKVEFLKDKEQNYVEWWLNNLNTD